MGDSIQLSVIIPVYNEKSTLEEILRRVAAISIQKEIIVVDDRSTDGTREILQSISENSHPYGRLKAVFHEENQGKGAAVRTGIGLSQGEVVIIQDADLEYDPREYPNLLGPILDGRADVVYGSRFLGGPHRVLYFWHYIGNRFLTLFSNMLTNLNLSDMETCYKAFRREVFDQIQIRSNRFEFEPEVTMKVAKKGFRVYETPISYSGRSYAEGKKITWIDGIKSVWAMVRFRLGD
ncbi:MAG: glycosyltransferase family 2 protein [Acidobacteria bacterium]|nr:glycosyltransferase family 2 protein [Acidobacteriota bacterium]